MKLYIMCGCSGAGKSTWIQNEMKNNPNSIWCSRDQVRFNMVKEEEEYFSKEDEVYLVWIENIQRAIRENIENIYIDATHLSEKARNKLLDSLCLTEECQLIPVNFHTSVEQCIANNENRTGRAYVPHSVIRNMYNSFKPASFNERYKYHTIIDVGLEVDK